MNFVYASPTEKDPRRCAAIEAGKLPRGGTTDMADVLGCSQTTIRVGLQELEAHEEDPRGDHNRREGGRRRKKEQRLLQTIEELESVIEQSTAGVPISEDIRWTYNSYTRVAEELEQREIPVSDKTAKHLLHDIGLGQRKPARQKTFRLVPERDAQFQRIARLREEFRTAGDPVLSMDTKQKERIGLVDDGTLVLADQPLEVLDHPLDSYADEVVAPHGMDDLAGHHAHWNLTTGSDCGEFACVSLQWYRQQTAHDPPHCSEFNPTEHRVFPPVDLARRGRLFGDVESLARVAEEDAHTKTGVKATAHVFETSFDPASPTQRQKAKNHSANFDNKLPKYNYILNP